MRKRKTGRVASVLLAVAMLLSVMSPITVYAEEYMPSESAAVISDEIDMDEPSNLAELGNETRDVDAPNDPEDGTGGTNTPVELDDAANSNEGISTEPEAAPTEEENPNEPVVTLDLAPVADYATFLADLKQLENYASEYVQSNPSENAAALVINFIRTGVERYTSSTWATLAGAENTAFTEYVAQQDAANGTAASALKDLEQLTLPNGNLVDLGHMFGAMDVANNAKMQGMLAAVVQARAYMGS